MHNFHLLRVLFAQVQSSQLWRIATLSVLAATTQVQGQVRVDAVAGKPFGVAQVSITLRPGVDRTMVETNGYSIESPDNRVFYPVFSNRRVLGILRQLVNPDGDAAPRSITAWFLFKGSEPFDVTIRCPESYRIRITPTFRNRRHQRFLRNWWRQYTTIAKQQIRNGDYPPIVETYLPIMLGQRLHLDLNRLPDSPEKSDLGSDLLGLAFNVESHRIAALRNLMFDQRLAQPRVHDLPPEIAWPASVHGRLEDVEVEPIAARVPEECFYIRFGTFANYLWLREFIEDNGGDLAQMATLRGHSSGLGEKLQDQLGLKDTALGKILGGQVISDVALIGRDTYLQEGAAIGVLFEAKNLLLGPNLSQQRKAAVERFKASGADIDTLEVAGKKVSFASTPDNRLRSFYVVSGKYHLVTNSRHLVERFLQTSKDKKSLATTTSFQQMRREFPLEQDDTVFVHISSAFFRGLLDWQYQIELRRRLNANASIQLVTMATWAANAEGLPSDHIGDLVRTNLLPPGFQLSAEQNEQSAWFDANRGLRGSYLPIPDTEIGKISASELATLEQIRTWQSQRWPDMDPITISIKRFALPEKDRERIRISARLLPFDREKYGKITSVVGPPTPTKVHTSVEDIVRFQMSFQGGKLLPSSGPHTIFFAMRDAAVPVDFGRNTFFRTIQVLRTAPAYLGAWPKPGLLDLLPLGQRLRQDYGPGLSRFPFGLWRWTDGVFSVLSFNRELLLDSIPQIEIENHQDDAQVRLLIGDIANSKLHSWFHALNYQRALETSIANTKLMHHVSSQFNLPVSDAKLLVEGLLAVNLTCALGGTYQLSNLQGMNFWESSKWPKPGQIKKFDSRLAEWFRGVELRLIMLNNRVIADALLDVKKPPQLELPFFNKNSNPFGRKPAADSEPPSPKTPPSNLPSRKPQIEELPPPEPLPPAQPSPN